MKIAVYERRCALRPTRRSRREIVVSREALIRAFSSPDLPRSEVLRVVAEYMGDSAVPPAWSKLGVRATFGKQIERRWSRYIRRLRPASYRAENGRWVTPIVQCAAQFGEFEKIASSAVDAARRVPPVFVDEFHYYRGDGC